MEDIGKLKLVFGNLEYGNIMKCSNQSCKTLIIGRRGREKASKVSTSIVTFEGIRADFRTIFKLDNYPLCSRCIAYAQDIRNYHLFVCEKCGNLIDIPPNMEEEVKGVHWAVCKECEEPDEIVD